MLPLVNEYVQERVLMRFSRQLSRFIASEDGVVSVDYVMFTAAVVGVGLIMWTTLGEGADGIAGAADTRFSTSRITVVN